MKQVQINTILPKNTNSRIKCRIPLTKALRKSFSWNASGKSRYSTNMNQETDFAAATILATASFLKAYIAHNIRYLSAAQAAVCCDVHLR
jgi:ribosomal protein S11